jgi:hypothetical protein
MRPRTRGLNGGASDANGYCSRHNITDEVMVQSRATVGRYNGNVQKVGHHAVTRDGLLQCSGGTCDNNQSKATSIKAHGAG